MAWSRTPAAIVVAVAIALAACASFAPEIGPVQGASAQPGADDAASGDDGGGSDTSIDAAADAGIGESGVDSTAAAETGPQVWTVLVGANGTHTFAPSALTVHAGDTVHWVWQESGHTVTSGTGGVGDGLFCSPNDVGCTGQNQTSGAGSTYDHVFAAAGSYPYFCRIHWDSGMLGTITVQ